MTVVAIRSNCSLDKDILSEALFLAVKFFGRDFRLGNDDFLAIAGSEIETVAAPGVAGNPDLINLHQNAVLIAIIAEIDKILDLAAAFALAP